MAARVATSPMWGSQRLHSRDGHSHQAEGRHMGMCLRLFTGCLGVTGFPKPYVHKQGRPCSAMVVNLMGKEDKAYEVGSA